jgi:HEAT repeat protein
LGGTKDSRAVEPLIAALKDPGVQQSAASALGKIKDPRAVEPLIAVLRVENSAFRKTAAKALGAIGTSAVEPLIAALKDANSGVRASAASALGETKDPRAVQPLILTLKDVARDIQENVAQSLGKIGTSAVEPLIAALKDPDPHVRRNAAWALRDIKGQVGPTIAALAPDAFDQDPGVVNALLAGWRELDLALIAGASAFFIQRGEAGSEDVLIRALEAYGTAGVAEDYLNCGNSVLRAAALKWAGYDVVYGSTGAHFQWGSRLPR